MGVRIIELTPQLVEVIVLDEHKPQIVLLCETRLYYRHTLTYLNFNILHTARYHPNQTARRPFEGTAKLC